MNALEHVLTVVSAVVVWGLVLFVSAGRFRWVRGWLCFALYSANMLAGFVVMQAANPGLLAERGKKHANTKRFDKFLGAVYAPLMFVLPLVAGLDAVRFGWSRMGWPSFYAGLAIFILGAIPVLWSMAVNRHVEATVRIQDDRGHQVVTAGPYRFVRHPMYAGAILQIFAAPLMLSSGWAFLPAGVTALIFVIRAGLEDQTLRRKLTGYAAYGPHTLPAGPGVW